MLFAIFSLLCLIKLSVASSQSDGENEILSFPIPLTQETLVIYEQERDSIFSLVQDEFRLKKKFTLDDGNFEQLRNSLQNLICKLGIKDLLKAIMQDDSDYVLVIFWLVFPRNIKSGKFIFIEYTLFPVSAMDNCVMPEIFKNFRRFLIKFQQSSALLVNQMAKNF